MGEPTREGRAEPSSRDQKLRRERGQELEDTSLCTKIYKKKKKYLLRKRGGEGERDGAQHDDKRVTTMTELVERNLPLLPITTWGRWRLWMESTAWAERRRSSTCTKRWAAASVCRKRGGAASLLFFKLDIMLFTAAASSEATGKERKAKVELDWLFARVSPVPKHDRQSSSETGY